MLSSSNTKRDNLVMKNWLLFFSYARAGTVNSSWLNRMLNAWPIITSVTHNLNKSYHLSLFLLFLTHNIILPEGSPDADSIWVDFKNSGRRDLFPLCLSLKQPIIVQEHFRQVFLKRHGYTFYVHGSAI